MDPDAEYQESTSITFEWTLRGLKSLFDSTKGEAKSKVTKSARFGGGQWQILFYANAGTSKEGSTDSGFISLYLSCEPSTEEREAALADSGRWLRDGVYKFSFELRNIGKTILYNLKEAHNHTFSHKTANWGWAQFARRDNVYYQSSAVKAQDAFVIICTITASPSTPPLPPALPVQSVPKSLLDTVGALLDDPVYCDVEFVIPRRSQSLKDARRIKASRRLLKRAEYFDTMFSSSFAEGSTEGLTLAPPDPQTIASTTASEVGDIVNDFEDSDDEEDGLADGIRPEPEKDLAHSLSALDLATSFTEHIPDGDDMEREDHRSIRATPSPSSPRGDNFVNLSPRSDPAQPPKMLTVVVKDVAYNTYRALLYYLYTDTIVFAPLSSSFIAARHLSRSPSTPTIALLPPQSEVQGHVSSYKRPTQLDLAKTRQEWLKEWQKSNPGRPAPCSAKAAYRLADRLDLRALKERASQHIIKSLTIENIAYEVFSPFTATFDEIRKVQVDFFLSHWENLRTSESMRNVWQQLRNGRHPGFEEVWFVITQNLEYKPTTRVSAGSSADTAR